MQLCSSWYMCRVYKLLITWMGPYSHSVPQVPLYFDCYTPLVCFCHCRVLRPPKGCCCWGVDMNCCVSGLPSLLAELQHGLACLGQNWWCCQGTVRSNQWPVCAQWIGDICYYWHRKKNFDVKWLPLAATFRKGEANIVWCFERWRVFLLKTN